MKEGSLAVNGVAWLENKIYVSCEGSNLVQVFPDQKPFDALEDEIIVIQEMKDPGDMAASTVTRSIFIADYSDKRCIWKIQMPGKQISQWEMGGDPFGLSINSSDELVVGLYCDLRSYINVYRCVDGKRIKAIPVLYDEAGVPRAGYVLPPVVQSSKGNFIIVHRNTVSPRVPMISEVSIDGKKIVRSIDRRLIELKNLKNWWPNHLSIDEDDNIFVADYNSNRIVLLNRRLDEHQILVKRHRPTRICYVQEKKILIVGQGGLLPSVSLFSLKKYRL